jgi:hypothetical protein
VRGASERDERVDARLQQVAVARVHHRTHLRLRRQRVAEAQLGETTEDGGEQLVGDGLLQQQPAQGPAPLAVELGEQVDHARRRTVEVGVVEHDDGVVAAELELGGLEVGRARRSDVATALEAAGERDRAHPGVVDQAAADVRAALHELEDPGRHPASVSARSAPRRTPWCRRAPTRWA